MDLSGSVTFKGIFLVIKTVNQHIVIFLHQFYFCKNEGILFSCCCSGNMTSHFIQLHLCLQYTRSSFMRAFTARLLIHHLLLPLLQTPASLSAAEAAAQCSMGTVEIRDGVEDKWPQFLITSCVSLQNTEAPDSALIQIGCWTSLGAELAL